MSNNKHQRTRAWLARALVTLAFSALAILVTTGGAFAGMPATGSVGSNLPTDTQKPTANKIEGVTGTPMPTYTRTPTPGTPTATSTVQCNGYQTSTSSGTLIPATNLVPGSRGDDVTATITLPFPVTFYGVGLTSAVVSSNGTLQFTSNNSAYNNTCLPDSTLSDVIAPYWDDLLTDGYPNDGIFTDVVGSAPNRQFVIEWKGCRYEDGGECAPGGNVDFEVNLSENAQTITIVYVATGGNDGASATSGVQSGIGGRFTQFSCNQPVLTSGLRVIYTPIIVCGTNTPTPLITSTATNTSTSTPTTAPGGTILGAVYISDTIALSDALVYACQTDYNTHCSALVTTDANGQYSLSMNVDGDYTVAIYPSSPSHVAPARIGPLTVQNGDVIEAPDMVLTNPVPAPPNTYFSEANPHGYDLDGIQHVDNTDGLHLIYQGCIGEGVATYYLYYGPGEQGGPITSGSLFEGHDGSGNPNGIYESDPDLPPFCCNNPLWGGGWFGSQYIHVKIELWCDPGVPIEENFDFYVDPSGNVRTENGDALPSATVTLYRSDSPNGPFVAVPNGSAMMSPANRQNPDTTDPTGHFAWDVVEGFYKVRAEHAGCTAPGNPNQPYVESAVLPVPPAVTDLDLRLRCPSIPTNTPTRTPTTTPTSTPTTISTPLPTCGAGSDYIITTGTDTSIPTLGTDIGNHCDDCSTMVTLPYAVDVYGQPFDHAMISSNGTISFGNGANDFTNTCLPNPSYYNTIFAYWADMDTRVTPECPDCGIYMLNTSRSNSSGKTPGLSPDNIIIITIGELTIIHGPNGDTFVKVEITISLSQYVTASAGRPFSITYNDLGGLNGDSATVGVQRETGTSFTQYSCSTANLSNGLKLTFSPPACGPSGVIHGQLTWQSVAAANRPLVTGTLTLCASGAPTAYSFNTDTTGAFTVTTGLPNGTYNWSVKGGRHISNSSPADGTALTISGGIATQNFGTQKGGNTNTDNLVNAGDFTNLKNQFGQGGIRSADADYNLVVNALDFNILKSNFGQAGHAITCP